MLAGCAADHAAPVRPRPPQPQAKPPVQAPPAPVAIAGSKGAFLHAEKGAQTCEPLTKVPDTRVIRSLGLPRPAIEDKTGKGLSHFYEAMAGLLRGTRKDHVRIGVFGDSNLAADFLTGEMRRQLQKAFGEGGHGFVGFGHSTPGYHHENVQVGLSKQGWEVFSVTTHPVRNKLYGFAGISAESFVGGGFAWAKQARRSEAFGKEFASAELYYGKGPSYGDFELQVDKKPVAKVDSSDAKLGVGFRKLHVPEGPHTITIKPKGRKHTYLLGISLERERPGVIVDSLGVGASTTATMLKQDPKGFHAALEHRNYDLLILQHASYDRAPWAEDKNHRVVTMAWLDRLEKALPNASILLLSPPDRQHTASQKHSDKGLVACRDDKRQFAKERGHGFWDLWQAMGGDGSMYRLFKHGLAWNDYTHFNKPGGHYMGSRMAKALRNGLASYVKTHPQAGCAPSGKRAGSKR